MQIEHSLISDGKKYMTTSQPLSKYRNIGIMAHIDAGKTTTLKEFYIILVNHKIGEVHDGAATMDWINKNKKEE